MIWEKKDGKNGFIERLSSFKKSKYQNEKACIEIDPSSKTKAKGDLIREKLSEIIGVRYDCTH